MALAVISIGSNIDPETHIVKALTKLRERTAVLAVSRVYETPPVGAAGTPPFLNMAVLVRTEHDSNALRTNVLRPLEAELGRVRTADPNAPRTIDLDPVLYATEGGDVTWYDSEALQFAHVAVPAAEVAGQWVLPDLGRTLQEVARQLSHQAQAFRRRPEVEHALKKTLPEAKFPDEDSTTTTLNRSPE